MIQRRKEYSGEINNKSKGIMAGNRKKVYRDHSRKRQHWPWEVGGAGLRSRPRGGTNPIWPWVTPHRPASQIPTCPVMLQR